MTDARRPVGRPGRYAKYEALEASLPAKMEKRPMYCDAIGLFRGSRSSTAWIKIRLPHGGVYKGRTVPAGGAVEHKAGNRASWTWQQLESERDRLQGLADRGEPLETVQAQSFADHATGWLKRKKSTLKGYSVTKGHVSSVLIPTFGDKALDAITVGDVNRWIGKQRTSLAPATVQRQLSTFNAIMNDAVRNGLIEKNPATRADKIRGIEARQRFVTDDEWQTIVATCEQIEREQEERRELMPQEKRGWLRHYVVWAYHSGMRRSEILGLTWANVRTVDAGHVVVEVLHSKNGKSRNVSCTAEMNSILEALRDLPRAEGDTRLFPVSLITLVRALTALWRATGLNDVRLHDLRRSHATILIGKGVDVRTVAGRLGHSGTAMLAKHYAVDRGDKAAAAAFG
jgi:integrase